MIRINNLELQENSCKYENSNLQLEFDIQNITLQELEQYFSLNTDTIIEQFVDETLINKWYYKEFQSIGYQKTDNGWHIQLVLTAMSVSSDDLTEIHYLIQEKENAILEIATLIDANETQLSSFNTKIEEMNEKIKLLNSTLTDRLSQLQDTIFRINNEYTSLSGRVSQLEK